MNETGLTMNERMELGRLERELQMERRQAEFDAARRKVERYQELLSYVFTITGVIAILLADIWLSGWAVWSVERAVDESWQRFPLDLEIGLIIGVISGMILSIASCRWEEWHHTDNVWRILGVVILKASVLQSASAAVIWLMLMIANQANGAPWAPYEVPFGICTGFLEASLLLMMIQMLGLTLIPNEEKLYHKYLNVTNS